MSGARERAEKALENGDVLMAYDAATAAVAEDPDDLVARYLRALALARSGAAERARFEAEALVADVERQPDAPARLQEDAEALVARVLKDHALAAHGQQRDALARAAAERYEAIATRLRRHFSCVNAATLWRLVGERERSDHLAVAALEYVASDADSDPNAAYWRAATRAEAHLLLGAVDAAEVALAEASQLDTGVAARATTRRQLSLVCDITGIDRAFVRALPLPTIAHYTGHRASSTIDGALERQLVDAVTVALDERRIDIVYGSIASGADVLVAECTLARGGEVNVVLPFDRDEFEALSLRPAGSVWVERAREVLRHAASVTSTSDSSYLGDDELFAHGARVAMGKAINRARALGTDVVQLALWDGHAGSAVAGTARDIEEWKGLRGDTIVVPWPSSREPTPADAPLRRAPAREIRAILFTDLRGFSRLRDEQYNAAVAHVLGPIAAALEPHRGALLFSKTWGDGSQLVFSDVVSAAHAALAMQDATAAIALDDMGLPADLDLRIGGHVGPVLAMPDPFDGSPCYWGREMTRTARIEPLTPEREVYVTEPFAALVELAASSALACEYVGRVTTAKAFETLPMYRLRHA